MLRDFKFLRRNSGKSEEIENLPVNPKDSAATQVGNDSARPPLNAIQEPKHEGFRTRPDKTPTKPKVGEPTLPLRTPENYSARNRFGWAKKNESNELHEDGSCCSTQVSRVIGIGNGGLPIMTPRATRTAQKATSAYSENNSTHSTPTKSVSKPPKSKVDGNVGARTGNFAALYKGLPISCGPSAVVNSEKVPHFDLKEDPSFWMDHNVQVIIRVRPLNSMEKSVNGYNRCLKQESSHSITWIGQPEARFTFDHVACETIDQETLFRMAGLPMVENCLSGYNSCMFAYGQTGSGKTYTMLGEIEDLEVKPSPHRGMTPRIFEFLFARIQAEEESRSDEKLKYSCKCSFIEIYNEQITDLLDPSSANLQLREDIKQGVYVENLSEFEVHSVSDILKLLIQGSSNRRVAATNMNRESSRSHSVFTCIIESRWEKDSATNLRFARLNLVDLAGSERQKTSGAEGERLKEAANINKSLSTLGHVIMVLVDVANGKSRHIPYRDSRLTFLLQDSLGGNSKTMVIANVSPSICSAAETLNTLKFAQRAKLIRNNAVVNEDSTGDVVALQNQIRLLKEELSALKHQNVSRCLSFGSDATGGTAHEQENSFTENTFIVQEHSDDLHRVEAKGIVRISTKQIESLKTTLTGALRREKMVETSAKQLEAEIEQLNRLVRQREEDTRSTKMMLKFREEKIQRMEYHLGGSTSMDAYLIDENRRLSEENQLLKAKIDKNPEVTRFALENIRLLEQLRTFQEFYEEGEKEILLAEISNMRDQLLQLLDGNSVQHSQSCSNMEPQEAMRIRKENDSLRIELGKTLNELEECKHKLDSCIADNAKLTRETSDLHTMLNALKSLISDKDGGVSKLQDSLKYPRSEDDRVDAFQKENLDEKLDTLTAKHAEETMNLQLELDILKIMLTEERLSCSEIEDQVQKLGRDLDVAKEKLFLTKRELEDAKGGLKEAKSVAEALESQQILALNETEDLKNSNSSYVDLLGKQELEIVSLEKQLSCKDNLPPNHARSKDSPLQAKLNKMHASLEKAKKLNMWYQSCCAVKATNEEEMDEVRRQAEAETAEVIVCMQEELSSLQMQVQDSHLKETEIRKKEMVLETELKDLQAKLFLVTEDNKQLSEKLEEKDMELRTLFEEWEALTCELEEILISGHETLLEASDQLNVISSSFPQKRIWISEQVGQMIRTMSEKELIIQDLTRCLEDANNRRSEVETMLESLRGAAFVITEAHQQQCSEKDSEISLLTSQLGAKSSSSALLEERMKLAEAHIKKVSTCATVAFVIVNRLSEANLNHVNTIKQKDREVSELTGMNLRKDSLLCDQAATISETEGQVQSLKKELAKFEETCLELRLKLSQEEERVYALEQKLENIQDDDILKTKEKLAELKTGVSSLQSCMSAYVEQHNKNPDDCDVQTPADNNNKGLIDTERVEDNNIDLHCVEDARTYASINGGKSANCKKYLKPDTFKDVCHKDVAIILLRREIESAMGSLRGVQAEMVKLRDEKEEIYMSEKRNQEVVKCLTTQLLSLEESISSFEKRYVAKMESFSHKLQIFEVMVQESVLYWCQTRKLLEEEVSDAWAVSTQKMAEASCGLAKFQEAQETMKEADIMIKGLMIANETMKLDVERIKKTEFIIRRERDTLITEVHDLQSINDMKSQQIKNLEDQLESNLTETRDLVAELEEVFAQFQTTFREEFMPIVCVLRHTKSLCLDSTQVVRSWVEDIWSDIIAKDYALSVLNICHMRILLETVMGLNAENGLLQHRLCESNSAIADLQEHNSKSKNELQMCRILKEKLLADIKNSFDRILRNEEKSGDLSVRIADFEKRISDLQFQEEQMVQRSNYMGFQLDILIKELDSNNSNVIESLLDQEKSMKEKEEELKFQSELVMKELYAKDIELLIFASRMQEVNCQKAAVEKECTICCTVLENFKKEIILFQVDAELAEQISVEKDVALVLLEKEVEEASEERQNLLSQLSQSKLRIAEMDKVKKILEEDFDSLKDVACSNDKFRAEISEINDEKLSLLKQIQELEKECEKLKNDINQKEIALENSSAHVAFLEQQNERLQQNVCLQEASAEGLHKELHTRDGELSNYRAVLEYLKEKYILSNLDADLKEDFLQCREVELFLLQREIEEVNQERQVLVSQLNQTSSKIKHWVEANQALEQQVQLLKDAACADGTLKCELAEAMEANNELLKRMQSLETKKCEVLMDLENKEKALDTSSGCISILHHENQKLQDEIYCIESRFTSLQADLSRKDDVIKGLSFDLRLLQESASNTKDQKDEIEELVASLQLVENELAVKSAELNEAVSRTQMLKSQLQEKIDAVSALELDILKERESVRLLMTENAELRVQVDCVIVERHSLEVELIEKKRTNESLEMELAETNNIVDQMNDNLDELTCERDDLQMEILNMKERVEAQAKEKEEMVMEAQQIAESKKAYAEEKEEEVKLLERSVEELECTINVLENKVELIKGEAERQRLQREELELELHALKNQMHKFKNSDADLQRHLDEKEKSLQKALKFVEVLEMEISEKGAEIGKLKAHITELNLHAEAQASEYKQKFRALESMVEQVRPDYHSTHIQTSSSNKVEKLPAKSRGSGSPFKCIGLGLAQQIKSERDEDLTAARQRIEELEALAVTRQKEIFALNARLASAESMTHDVIRDLLGVKLDVTTYASLLDNQQVQKIAEKAQIHTQDSKAKEQEVMKLKHQLSEFIEERKSWLEEIERKQAELVAGQIALEQLRQRDQLFKTENEMLKMESINQKKRVKELEGEVKKLSGQQNLQQRIHHHAKIKEENNMLKLQNEELGTKLRRAEVILSRVREELARHRAAVGKSPYINFDEEQRLSNKMKEIEEDRVQLAQKLLGLCTSILKAAGITRPASDVNPSIAEEALEQLKNRVISLERELQDMKFKNKLNNERARLSELRPQSSPMSSKSEENCHTPRRFTQTPYLSALDR